MRHRVATGHASKEDWGWNAATSLGVVNGLHRSHLASFRKATLQLYRISAANAEGSGSMTVTRSRLW